MSKLIEHITARRKETTGNRRYRLLFLVILLSIPCFAFQTQAAARKIQITGSKYVARGKTIRLTADQDVTWESSDPTIATVSKKGKVKGLQPGKVTITATSKRSPAVRKRIKICVTKKAVKKIRLSSKKLRLDITENPLSVLHAYALPSKAAQSFSWSSSNPKIAAVNAKGAVKALKAGTARITCMATDGSKKKVSITVTVTDKKEEARKKQEAERKKQEEERKKQEEEERKKQEEEERKKREAEAAYCNILLIGNSYTQDEFGYVPALLKEFFPALKFRIGLLYTGGASLELHYANLTNVENTYQYYSEYTSEDTRWTHWQGVRLSDVITKYAWKIVTLQQCSALQGSYSSMEPYIKKLLDGYAQKLGTKPVYLYVFPHVRGSKNSQISPGTTADAYKKYVPIVQKVMSTFAFSNVIPNATAIENARTTVLKNYGKGGDMTSDTTHLQDGLPCLVANYCSFLKLLPYIGDYQVDLTKSRILPTKEWIAAQSIPGADGLSDGVTETHRLLAVRCAASAVSTPYAISAIQ